jgi:hypothetical protein
MSETNISAAGRDQLRADQAHREPFTVSFLVQMGSGHGVMSKTAHYFRKKAADCERAARRTRDLQLKLELLDLAQAWILLAERADQLIGSRVQFISDAKRDKSDE